LNYPANPPVLHSFPTRRSSDLVVENGKVVGVLMRSGLIEALAKRGADIPVREAMEAACPVVQDTENLEDSVKHMREAGCTVEPVDRKSTRLNSSHVSISYAVFC